MSTDRNATTPQQANEFAITDSAAVISGLTGANQVPAVNLYKNAQAKSGMVVQVDVTYNGKRGNGGKYDVHIMLDVDVPPPGSTQEPHIGWEVKLNGQRVGNGHDWVPADVFKVGRPAPGTPLETYPIAPEEKKFEGNGEVVAAGSFRRYKS
ncbi:MAG: hypothetical protein M1836_002171 [Candelina mexicana]|nr:MAG: hypothetical protein M1836_002171 [Candelina mexicana]